MLIWGNGVLSLPIRNWNHRVEGEDLEGISGFEPTYKELKPDPHHPDRDEELGFEPTYKELKPRLIPYESFPSSSFWAYL